MYSDRGRVFSLTTCTADRKPHFRSSRLTAKCVDHLAAVGRRCGTSVHAYCFMPDHVHLLAETEGDESIVEFMRVWKGVTDHDWRQRGGAGKLWQRSFFDHALRDQESIEAVADYIVNNPVRAGLVEDWREYPFSGSMTIDL